MKKVEKNDTKIYCILAYIGILWIIGLLSDQKNKEEVKFHVGQGMLVSIVYVLILIVNNIFITNLFFTRNALGIIAMTGVGVFVMSILWLVPVAFSVIGIINALKGENKALPFIGKFTFYK